MKNYCVLFIKNVAEHLSRFGTNATNRIIGIISGTSIDITEVVNAYLFYSWASSLYSQPDYLNSSPYLKIIAASVSPQVCLNVAGSFLLVQVAFILFGGIPSYFIREQRHVYQWLYARLVLLGSLSLMWAWLGFIQTQVRSNNVGTKMWFGAAFLCFFGVCKLVFKIMVEQKVVSKRETKKILKSREIVEVPL